MFGLLKVDDDNTKTPTKTPLYQELRLISTEISDQQWK